MAFDTQITDLVGGTIDQVACDQWAADACKEIINVLPEKLKAKCSTVSTLNDSSTTLDVDGIGDILHVTRLSANSGGYQISCREIPAQYGGLAEDSTDLNYYATATDPVFWVDSSSDVSTLKVKPTTTANQTAIVHHITYPTVNVSDVSIIANFPDEAEHLVVLYVAIKQLHQYMNSKRSDLPSDLTLPILESVSESLPTWSAPSDFVIPVKPVVPSLSAQSVTITGTAPTYIQSVFSAPSLGSIGSLTLPSAPVSLASPSFSTPTIGAITVASTTLTNAGTAPLYTKPSLTTRVAFSGYTSGLGDADPGVFSLTAIAPTVPSAPSYTTPDITSTTISSTLVSDLGVPPTYTAPTIPSTAAGGTTTDDLTDMVDSDWTSFDFDFDDENIDFATWFQAVGDMIQNQEDIELASAQLQKISTYVQTYGVAMQNRLNTFNKENVAYQAKVQEGIQQAQINATKAQGQAQISATEAQQEASLLLQKEQQEYSAKLQKYQAEVSTYQANVSKEVQEYGQKLQRYSTELNTSYTAWAKTESDSLQQYSADIQNNLNDYNRANAEYQVKLQEATTQAQLNSQKAQQQAQIDSTDAQQEASLKLQKENQEYSSKLQKYQAEVSTYNAEVNAKVQEWVNEEWTQNFQKYQTDYSNRLQEYSSDMQNELNKFNKENVEYQAKLQKDVQDAQLSDANEVRKLQKYQAEVGTYSAEVNTNVQIFTQALAKNRAAFDTSLQKYTSEVQKVSSSNASTLQKFQTETADYSAKLQKQGIDYQWYQSQYAALKVDYQQGLQQLISGGASPPAQQQGR